MTAPARAVNRRRFLVMVIGAAGGMLASCANQPPPSAAPAKPAAEPTAAPAKPTAPTAQVVVPTPAPTAPPTAVPAAAPTNGVKRGGVLRINAQNDWSTMDLQTSQTGNPDSPFVYDFLTRIDRHPQTGAFEVKPSLAESWELPDPTTVVLKLRRGVKFHDGSDFDASVVKWNLERSLTHPKSTAKAQVAAIGSVDVVDPATVRLSLKAASPSLFVNLTSDARYVSMMSKAHHDKVGDEGVTREAVGTGPFRMVEWKPGSHVAYERFDGYWVTGADGKPLPYPDRVEVSFQPDSTVALTQLRSGSLDLLPIVLGKDLPTIKGNPQLVHREAPWQSTVYCLAFNAQPGARFAGEQMKKVRQAVMYAIDRDGIATALGQGIGQPTGYLLAPGQIGFDESLPKYSFDVARGRELMAEAGYPNGLDVTLDYIARPEDQQNAQLYQQMLEKIGVRLTLEPAERVAWVQKTMAGNYEFAAFQTGAPRPDSDLTLTAYLGSKGTSGWAGIDDPEIDRLLEEGRTTYDVPRREAAYKRVQEIVHDGAHVGFTWRRSGGWGISKAVQDFADPYLSVVINSTQLWLDR